MALVKWTRDGYGQLERNRIETDNIESQCELNATAFPNGAEVGSIVAVDKATGKLNLTGGPLGILANAEKLYYPTQMGLKNYHVEGGKMGSVIFPNVGNTWTTNTITYDNGAYANDAVVISAVANTNGAVYGVQCSTTGEVQLVNASTTTVNGITLPASSLVLRAVKNTTMPDGQKAIKFIVISK